MSKREYISKTKDQYGYLEFTFKWDLEDERQIEVRAYGIFRYADPHCDYGYYPDHVEDLKVDMFIGDSDLEPSEIPEKEFKDIQEYAEGLYFDDAEEKREEYAEYVRDRGIRARLAYNKRIKEEAE